MAYAGSGRGTPCGCPFAGQARGAAPTWPRVLLLAVGAPRIGSGSTRDMADFMQTKTIIEDIEHITGKRLCLRQPWLN